MAKNAGMEIKVFRNARDWSQARLAGELGVHPMTVWRLENGHSPIKPYVLKALEGLASQYPPVREAAE